MKCGSPVFDQTSGSGLQSAATATSRKHFGVFGGLAVRQDNCNLRALCEEQVLTGFTGNQPSHAASPSIVAVIASEPVVPAAGALAAAIQALV
jgi:hypothetical protein